MTPLNNVSYYLSYTDCFPVVNIPSGAVHLLCAVAKLICGIIEAIFGATPYQPIEGEDFESLTYRKLDDWTHLGKAIAILSFFGIVFLWEHINRIYRDLAHVTGVFNPRPFETHDIPARLLEDREWVEAAVRRHGDHFSHDIFRRTSARLMGDGEWILQLVERGVFKPWHFYLLNQNLQHYRTIAIRCLEMASIIGSHQIYNALPERHRNDPEIINRMTTNALHYIETASFAGGFSEFRQLPEPCKSNPAIIDRLFAKALANVDDVMTMISIDKTLCSRCSVELCAEALGRGLISIQRLPSRQRSDYRVWLAAIQYGHRYWGELSSRGRSNPDLLRGLRAWFVKGYSERGNPFGAAGGWFNAVVRDKEWFQQLQARDAQNAKAIVKADAFSFEELFS